MDIDLTDIAGIRDLQGSKAISRRMKDGKNSWSLSNVAMILGLKPQNKIHSAMEDADLTRQIYRKVESQWEDNTNEEILALRYRKINVKAAPSKSRLHFSADIVMDKNVKKDE